MQGDSDRSRILTRKSEKLLQGGNTQSVKGYRADVYISAIYTRAVTEEMKINWIVGRSRYGDQVTGKNGATLRTFGERWRMTGSGKQRLSSWKAIKEREGRCHDVSSWLIC